MLKALEKEGDDQGEDCHLQLGVAVNRHQTNLKGAGLGLGVRGFSSAQRPATQRQCQRQRPRGTRIREEGVEVRSSLSLWCPLQQSCTHIPQRSGAFWLSCVRGLHAHYTAH